MQYFIFFFYLKIREDYQENIVNLEMRIHNRFLTNLFLFFVKIGNFVYPIGKRIKQLKRNK